MLFLQLPMDVLLVLFLCYKIVIVEFLNHLIEDPDHFGREVDELIVQLPVILSQMSSLDDKHFGLSHVEVEHLVAVDLFSNQLAFDLLDHFELIDELDQSFLGTGR